MLPFLKPKKMSSMIIAKRAKSGGTTPEREEGEATPELHGIAERLMGAFSAGDSKAAAEAMEAAHKHLSAQTDSQKPNGEPAE